MKVGNKFCFINLVMVFLFMILWTGGVVSGETYLNELYNKANNNYENRKYIEAIEDYEKIINMGGKNADVFYDLGNAYFKDNQLGMAILNYERALKYNKRDKEAIDNLNIAKLLIKDKEPFTKKSIIGLPIRFIQNNITMFEGIVFTTIIFWLLMGCLIVVLLASRKKLFIRITYILTIFLVIGLISIAVIYFGEEKAPAAIVIVPETDVMSGPGENYSVSFKLHDGTKVYIDAHQYNWYKIHLVNKMTGWLREDSVEKI